MIYINSKGETFNKVYMHAHVRVFECIHACVCMLACRNLVHGVSFLKILTRPSFWIYNDFVPKQHLC